MIGADFAETEARVERVMGFIRDTVAEADVSEPAGHGAGWCVGYDEAAIRAFILEVMVGVALPLPPVENPSEVIGYAWEVNAQHVNVGRGLVLGDRRRTVSGIPTERPPRGLTEVWIMRNGQEVRATWKPAPPAPDPTFRPPLVSSPEACWPEEELRAAHAAKRDKR